jgi:hypothetical protein
MQMPNVQKERREPGKGTKVRDIGEGYEFRPENEFVIKGGEQVHVRDKRVKPCCRV